MLLGTKQPQELRVNSCRKLSSVLSSHGSLLSLVRVNVLGAFREEEGVAEKLTGSLDSSPRHTQYGSEAQRDWV